MARKAKRGRQLLQPATLDQLLLQVRGNQVSVLGQVGRPGRYPLETGNVPQLPLAALLGAVFFVFRQKLMG